MGIKGKNGSYFHHNYIEPRDEDLELGGALIDSTGDDVTCRLNGYAIIPLEEYYRLKGEVMPDNIKENIESCLRELTKYPVCDENIQGD